MGDWDLVGWAGIAAGGLGFGLATVDALWTDLSNLSVLGWHPGGSPPDFEMFQLTGNYGGQVGLYVKWQDFLMTLGGVLCLLAAIRGAGHRLLFGFLGVIGILGGVSGVLTGWDGD